MHPEKQRIALANLEGFKLHEEEGHQEWEYPDGSRMQVMFGNHLNSDAEPIIPDYLHDLDAILGIVRNIKNTKQYSSNPSDYETVRYMSHLYKIVGIEMRTLTVLDKVNSRFEKPYYLNTSTFANPFEPFKLVTATAAQHCEAVLKTYNLWTDD